MANSQRIAVGSGGTGDLGEDICRRLADDGYLRTRMVAKVTPDVMRERILPQIPIGRLGVPAEVADIVAYLASDRTAFMTGANLSINGVQHMYRAGLQKVHIRDWTLPI